MLYPSMIFYSAVGLGGFGFCRRFAFPVVSQLSSQFLVAHILQHLCLFGLGLFFERVLELSLGLQVLAEFT